MRSKIGKFLRALTLAQFALDCGRQARGLKCLHRALRWGREENYINFPFFRPESMVLLCAEALQAEIETDYVKELIRKRNLQPPREFFGTLEAWPWRVKIYTLGQFSLWLSDEQLTFPKKAQQKPLELLKLIIAYGRRGVTVSELADNLWPASEGDAAHRSFATTLHRLRRLLKGDQVLLLQNARLTLNTQRCWVDAWAFENLVRGMGEDVLRSNIDHTAQRCSMIINQTLKLYQGPFLSGEAGISSVVSTRERLRTKFLHCLCRLGAYLEQSDRLQEAISCYQRGLEAEAVAEELYIGLMRCYLTLGRRSEAISLYRLCREVLAANLGSEPSKIAHSLYKTALSIYCQSG